MNQYNDFAAESQEVFIDTQSSFGESAPGNQFDDFKINFNTQPFEAGDDSQIRLTLTQFNAGKTWYDINANNNQIRLFNAASSNMNATDVMITIPPADYMNINVLADRLGRTLKAQFDTTFKIGNVAYVATGTQQTASVADPTLQTGILVPTVHPYQNSNKILLKFTAPGSQAWDTNVILQTMQIPTDTINTLTGGTDPLTGSEQFNDSYWLLGGKRIETFEQTAATQSFQVAITTTLNANDTLTIESSFPCASEVHTLPHLYLRCDVADNQVSSNMISANEQHNHSATHSTILGKIPRVMNGRQQVSYTLDSGLTRYFSNINTRFLNDIRFSVVDHRGRRIPEVRPGQKTVGNMFLNLALKVEKVKVPFTPNILQAPPPPDVPLKARTNAFSLAGTNQNINPFN